MLRSSYQLSASVLCGKEKSRNKDLRSYLGIKRKTCRIGGPALTDCATSLLSLIMASPSFVAYYINKVGTATSGYLEYVNECDIEQHYTPNIADFNSMHDAW